MQDPKIVLFSQLWSTIWGGGSSQQGNCISKNTGNDYLSSKTYENYTIEKAKLIISLFVWLTHMYVHCTYVY